MADTIPVVDFSAFSLDRDEPDLNGYQSLINEVYSACTTIGFIYIKNSGITQEKLDKCFDTSRRFFELDKDVKLKYQLPNNFIHGYMCMGRERSAKTGTVVKGNKVLRPHGDLKEGFSFNPAASEIPKAWPEELPELRESMEALMEAGKPFLHRLLEVMARGLKCEDPHIFTKRHAHIGSPEGLTVIRSNYYPATEGIQVKDHQIRAGEHSDFGSVTLLLQKEPGLEVQNFNGDWISAPPIDGTIVVNIGDAMQRWTSDRFVSTKHRVVNPISDVDKQSARQSIVYFGAPDAATIIECIDGSHKYPPIEMEEYYLRQYNKVQTDTRQS